jgi:hypothetical protein
MAEKKTSAFYWACRNDDIDTVKRILQNLSSADINRIESNGSTALHAASYYGHARIVQLLLEGGADTTVKNKYGITAKEDASTDEVRDMFETIFKEEDDDDDIPQSDFVLLYPNAEGIDKSKLGTRIFKARLITYNANKYTISAKSNLEHLEEKYRKSCQERGKMNCLKTGEKYFKQYRQTGDFQSILRFYTEETPFYKIARNDVPFLVEMYKHLLRYKTLNFKGRAYRANRLFPKDLEPYRWALKHPRSLLELRRTASTSRLYEMALKFLHHKKLEGSLNVILQMDFHEPCFTALVLQSSALFPDEEEILVLSGTFFEVAQIQQDENGYIIISLNHVPVDEEVLSTVI